MPPSTGSYAARSAASSADSGDSADPLAHIVEDSSAPVGVPFYAQHAASRSSTTARAGSAPVRQSFFRTLFFRRTIIPVLLTMGLALPAIAVWWFLLDQDAPLKQTGPILPLTLLVVGAMLLLLAIANILVVRQQLKQSPQPLVR